MTPQDMNRLLDLLAIIHRDGGHYAQEHGIEKAVEDAHKIWAELIQYKEMYLDLVKMANLWRSVAEALTEGTSINHKLEQIRRLASGVTDYRASNLTQDAGEAAVPSNNDGVADDAGREDSPATIPVTSGDEPQPEVK